MSGEIPQDLLDAEARLKEKLANAETIDAVAERQQFLDNVAAHYNAASPREQKRMDAGLRRLQAQRVAQPRALFNLFPALRRPLVVKR